MQTGFFFCFQIDIDEMHRGLRIQTTITVAYTQQRTYPKFETIQKTQKTNGAYGPPLRKLTVNVNYELFAAR
jgi:hypothetical protein